MTVGTARMHDSAPLHVSGQAQYCDDIVLPENALHAAFGMSPIAHGRIAAKRRGMRLHSRCRLA